MDIKLVLDRMYADRQIYCIQPWCVRAGTSPAPSSSSA
jgi:hypothetical protein